MQASGRPRRRANAALVDEFHAHWDALGRFMLDRKRQAPAPVEGPDLTLRQLHALLMLNESPMRMGDFGPSLGMAESSATRMIDRLVSEGLVTRTTDQRDRRVVVAEITDQGRALVRDRAARRRVLLEQVLGSLGPDEQRELVSLFGRVIGFLERARTQGPAESGAGHRQQVAAGSAR